MTLSDLTPDFDVTTFLKVEYLSPDWFYMRDIGPVRACERAERERAENRASGSGELGERTFQKTLERSVEAAERERSGKRA